MKSSRFSSACLIPLLAVASILSVGCFDPVPPANLVIISIDTLRADHLHTYGYERQTSPNLDDFARGAVLFKNAYSPTAWTLQGHASMLSGRSPRAVMTSENSLRVREQVPLLAELLKAKGYQTGAVHSAHFLKPEFGFERGFDHYQFFRNDRDQWKQQEAANTKLLESLGEEPFFVFFHFMSVHTPYNPPKKHDLFKRPYRGELTQEDNWEQMLEIYDGEREIDSRDLDYIVDLYDGAIHLTDSRVGNLLQELGKRDDFDRTYVLITSDHGEEFLEHDGVQHTRTLYDEVLRVPMLLSGPKLPGGVRVSDRVSLIDVVPTVLSLLKLPVPPGLDGRDLSPTWNEDSREVPPLELATYYPKHKASKWGLLTETHKLVIDLESGEKFLFNLVQDPGELHNLSPSPLADQLEAQLRKHPEPKYGTELEISEADREELRKLGYVE